MPKHENSKVMILTHGLYPIPGHTVSGNGIRAWGLAMGLVHNGFEVIYSTPSDTVHPHTPRPEVTLAPYTDKADLHSQIESRRPAVLIIGYWAYMHLIPWDIDIPLVMDLLAPWLLEAEFQETYDMEIESIDYIKCLNRADYFICCTQRQKAFHTAWLFMSGFGSKGNPLDVIPISANPELPVRSEPPQEKNPVFLYGGVLWPWRSPQGWITILLEILADEQKGLLQLITGKYPLHEASSSGSLQLPKGPRYDGVLKQSDLLPYDEMERLYLQADVGIELSARNSEREFSFSFRVIEYLRCGLPVICNDFLEVAELIQQYDAGWVLDSSDNRALETVVKRIMSGQEDIFMKSTNARRLVREKFNCLETIQPLARFCSHPLKREKSRHFLLSLIQHDQNVHDLQTSVNALRQQLADKELLLEEKKERIGQFQVQIEHMAGAQKKAVAWHEKTQAALYQHFQESRSQLILWQGIAEERRLSVRLKRLKNRMFPFSKKALELPETCLFQAAEKDLTLNLSQLCRQLPLNPVPELLKTGEAPLDYQQQAIDRFFSYVDVNGKTVLEIGADNAVILSEFAQKGMALGVGINNWYWSDKNPKTIKVSDNIILSYGDIRSIPLEDESFDIIFTVAAFEHIHQLDLALKEMYRLLKPGGIVYSLYGPLWSCGIGHHLWFEREGAWYRFSEPETTLPVLDNYEHLLLDRDEMAEKLSHNWDKAAVDDFLYQIYDCEHINRYMYSDYLEMFNNSEFEVMALENDGIMPIEPEIKEQLCIKYGSENNFACANLEVVLKKPEVFQGGFKQGYAAWADGIFGKVPFFSSMQKIIKKFYRSAGFIYRGSVKRLLIPLWKRRGKINLAIVTRDDVFPVDHGAAAKIYHTARVLSYEYDEVYLITLDREKFFVFSNGENHEELYPRLLRELWYPTEEILREKLTSAGIPNKESFLFFPKIDKNFRLRVLYVALQKSISVYQAEFPSFVDACTWACRIFGGKRSIVEHNLEFQRISDTYQLADPVKNYMQDYEVMLCNSVDHVITVSHNDTRGLIKAGVSEDRITMIPHGVDLENFEVKGENLFSIRSRYGISQDEIVLIFHGIYSYAPNDQAAELIGSKVLPALNSRGFYPKCLAVGKYPPEKSNHSDLIYTGVVEHVAPYIKAADIAVVPLQDGGGTRMKILEYFAAAIPVVATSKGAEGIDVVPGEEIIIEDSIDKIVEAIIRLIRNPDERYEIGIAGRRFVEALDWFQIGKRYARLYGRLEV